MKKKSGKLNKKAIGIEMKKMLMGGSMTPPLAHKIVLDWNLWFQAKKWIEANPARKNDVAWWDDEGEQTTIIEDHHERFSELKQNTLGLILEAFSSSDPTFFWDIAAEISNQNRLASKRKHGFKEFNIKDFLLLKDAYSGSPNVHRLAKHLIESGQTEKSQTLDSVVADLFRRRKKLKLPSIG
jgi:hypothetical protein